MGRLKTLGQKLIEMDRLGDEVDRSLFEAQLQDIIDELNLHRSEMSIGGLSKDTQYLSEERFIYKLGHVRENDEEVFKDLHRFALEEVVNNFLEDYTLIYSNVRAGFPSAALSEEEKEGLRERGWREVLVRKYALQPDITWEDEELRELYQDSYAAFFLLREKHTGDLFIFRFFVVGEWT